MSQQNSDNLHDNAIGWTILAVIFFVLLILIYYFFHPEIHSMVRWWRYGELWILSWFVSSDYVVRIDENTSLEFWEWFHATPHIPMEKITTDTLAHLSYLALLPLRYAFIAIIGAMGIWAAMRGPGTEYRRKMDLDGLIAAQAKTFPIISPFVKFNPSNMPPRPPGSPVPAELPPFAEALGPEEWLAYFSIPVPDGQVDEQAAFLAFAKQLGPRWKGPNKLAPHKQVILAACCLKASRKRAEADNMLGRLASCWSEKGGLQLGRDKNLLKDARKVLRNQKLAGSTISKSNMHAFETTAMMRALTTAREEGGVLAPAQFVWLRAHDRTLWYPLNNLGRQSYHMEALGAMAHYKAEKMTLRPIPMPKVQDAVETIAEYMMSTRARPIPALNYSGSKKKRGIKKPQNAGVKKPNKKS